MAIPDEGVIDAHVHLYPPEVNADPVGWADRQGERLWREMVEERPDRRVRQGFVSVDRLLRDMDAAGVAHVILLGWYWERPETCELQNRFYAQCVRAHPDRISAFATVQASDGDRALAEMRRARDAGLIGLGEMCPWAFGGRPTDEQWLPIFEQAVEMDWPVNLHVTDPASRAVPGRVETPLEDVLALAETLPELRLILAHLGGGLAFLEPGYRVHRALKNAIYDTAAVPLLYRRSGWQAAIKAAGAERVAFGTDYPLMVFPRTQVEPGLTESVALLREVCADAGVAGQVGGETIRRFLRRT